MSNATTVNMITKNPNLETKTRSIPFVNPNAADSDVATFFATLNSLTDNKLKKLEKVSTSDLSLPQI